MEKTNTLELFKETRDSLRITKTVFSGLRNLDQQTLIELNAGDWLPSLDSTKPYFSPMFLLDKDNDVAYPMFFCADDVKKENSTVLVRKTNHLPIFNSAALDVIESYGIDAHDITRADDWDSYQLSLNSAIEMINLKNTIEVVLKFSFISEETIFYNFYPWLKDRIAGSDLPVKFKGLFDKANTGPKTDNGLFSPMRETLKRLDEEDSAKVVYREDAVCKPYIVELITEQMEKGKSVVFLYPKEEKEFVDSLFTSEKSERRAFELANAESSVEEFFKSNESNEDYPERDTEHTDIRQKRLSLSIRKKNFDSKENETVSLMPLDILVDAKKHDAKIYPIDISDYTIEDIKKDNGYFKMLSEMNKLPDLYSESHFVGLSCSGKRENYDRLMLTITMLSKELTDIKTFAESNNLKGFDDKPINNFDSATRYLNDMNIISAYSGFPLEMFDQDYEAENLDNLEELYKKVSSSNLMVYNFFDKGIFDEDLNSLFKDFSSGSFLQARKAKKKILSHLKNDADYDFDSLLKLLKTAFNYNEELKKVLPEYEWTYGMKVNNYNGLIEVKHNLEYISKVKQHEKKFPYFSFENDEIKACLNDKNFFNEKQQLALVLQTHYENVRYNMNTFVGMFLDLKVPYTFLTFDELYDLFENVQKGKYEEFEEYARMKEGASFSSIQAQLITKKALAEGKTSTERTESFYLSLLNALRNERKEKSAVIAAEFEENAEQYTALASSAENTMIFNLYDSIDRQADSRCDSIRFHDAYKTLKINYKNSNISYDDYENVDYLLSCLHPFSLARTSDILTLGEESVDLIIIFDSAKLSFPIIVKAILLGKKVLFFESASDFDSRTQGYSTISLSSDSLYSGVSAVRIDDKFLDYLNGYFSQSGYRLISDGNAFPFVLVDSEGSEKYAVLFDEFVDSEESEDIYVNLPVFLQSCYSMDLIFLSIDDLILEPENTILSAFEKVALKKLS